MCLGQTQLGKNCTIPHDTKQWKAPVRNCSQPALFTKDTANLFIQNQAQHFQRGTSHMIFLSHQDMGCYQRCVPLLHLNAFTCFVLFCFVFSHGVLWDTHLENPSHHVILGKNGTNNGIVSDFYKYMTKASYKFLRLNNMRRKTLIVPQILTGIPSD